MGDPRGYYRVLGVPRSATAEQIRRAFRERAKASHPDQIDGAGNAETFRLIREAYEVLREPRQRMAYDATGFVLEEDETPVTTPPPQPRTAEQRRETAETVPPSGDGTIVPTWLQQHLAPLAAGVLALALVVALGSLWSVQRQLADRESVLAEAHERLAQLSEEQADLLARYRGLAFQELESGLGRGSSASLVAGDPAYLHEIPFRFGTSAIESDQESRLAQALSDIARLIETLPVNADWLIVIEASASRVAYGDRVAVEEWEPALIRIATVLDHVLARGLPGERIAIRFNAGFGAPGIAPSPADPGASSQDRLLLKLVCCYAQD